MEDEFDLRTYIEQLFRHWRLLVVTTLLAGMVALAAGFASPSKYQATAVLLLSRPFYQIQFSSEIRNVTDTSGSQQLLTEKAALELATSNAVLQEVLLEVDDDLPADARNLSSLRALLQAKAGGDPSIINLYATASDPQQAANLANVWANVYVQQVNDLYGRSGNQLEFFEEQLAQAAEDLQRADQALVEFEQRNDLAILKAQLSAKQNALNNNLGWNESLVTLHQDVKNLQDQLARRPAATSATLGDDLAQLLLQISALTVRWGALPIQLQMPSTGNLSDTSAEQQVAYLVELLETIEAKQATVKTQIEILPAEIKALQGQVQAALTESNRLVRQRDLAETVHKTLSQKVKESEISAQDTSGRVRVASNAITPDRPIGRNLMKRTVFALILGLSTGIVTVLVLTYVRKSAKVSTAPRPEHKPAAETA